MKKSFLTLLIMAGVAGTVIVLALFNSMLGKHVVGCDEVSTRVQCVTDYAIQNNDVGYCRNITDPANKEMCEKVAAAALNNPEQCNNVRTPGGKFHCYTNYGSIDAFRTSEEMQNYTFYNYRQTQVEVTFADDTKKTYEVDIADSTDMRSQGLSYREQLGKDRGMLFDITPEGQVSFFMRSMLLSLDIIYLDKDGNVVDAFRNLPSCVTYTSECELKTSSKDTVRWVLEIEPTGKEVKQVQILDPAVFEVQE